uniref:Uncharacterized protein n=1 Tax=Buteo japonicus TaxID=224669 RepID=A0A8C0BII4_9AVES
YALADATRAVELDKKYVKGYYRRKDYENAVKYYSSAIELNPTNAIYYGNRSLAYLRTECYGYALADATRAVELDKKYVKGYYRRAASNMALGKFKAALPSVRALELRDPWGHCPPMVESWGDLWDPLSPTVLAHAPEL